MARTRRPLWVGRSLLNLTVLNVLLLEAFELAHYTLGSYWALRLPLTKAVAVSSAVAAAFYYRGSLAFTGKDGPVIWRPRELPELGEPPAGNTLAWPAPDDAAPRVATAAARGLTQRRPYAPVDRGSAPSGLVLTPVFGGVAGLAFFLFGAIANSFFPSAAQWLTWYFQAWLATVWVCWAAAAVLQTVRLNRES